MIDVIVQGCNRQLQLRMVGYDHIGGLSLRNQRSNNLVDLVEPFSGQVNAGSGGCCLLYTSDAADELSDV